MPKTSSNHKSDTGSPQCPDPLGRCSQRLIKRHETAPIATCDGGKVGPCGFRRGAPVARGPCRKQIRPEDEGSVPALREQISWSGLPGLGSKGSARQGMASAIMERSARHRAGSAAGGTAMTLRHAHCQPRADAISGIPTGARRRSFSPALRSAAAGGKRYNAQQNACRRLPPGGNQGCRRSR